MRLLLLAFNHQTRQIGALVPGNPKITIPLSEVDGHIVFARAITLLGGPGHRP
jgi:hypothetical protein